MNWWPLNVYGKRFVFGLTSTWVKKLAHKVKYSMLQC